MFDNNRDKSTFEHKLGMEFVEISSFAPEFIILSYALSKRIA